ncbi:MAG: hypothetical protein GF383_15805 [Candidatus Lokiarchaeota archaeon]|nr:hypothetical protein [Candidatus Lokiarchaeota archaeon]MBD3343165.1 hypothetical protein [Candidatus Lokiarchaeota archaeon]
MNSLDFKRGTCPIIIKPNLGQPLLININDSKDINGKFLSKINLSFVLVAGSEIPISKISSDISSNVYIQPILKAEGDFHKRRGKLYSLELEKLEKIERPKALIKKRVTKKNYQHWDIFNNLTEINNLYGKRSELYNAYFQWTNAEDILNLFKTLDREVILFDLIQEIPKKSARRTNYHSVAIYNKRFEYFKFIHSTDPHIARRCDFLIKLIKDRAKRKLNYRINRKTIDHDKVPFILKRDFEIKEGFQKARVEKIRYAKYNYNYNLRLLIDFVNSQVCDKNLDFVAITGDLVDYIRIARGNFEYENNFEVFIDIILGRHKDLDKFPFFRDKEFINKKEILAPIFTLVGNHDYRKGHYNIRFGKFRKMFGLRKNDLNDYYDMKYFNFLSSLLSKKKYLRDYFRHINPNLTYSLTLSNDFKFIFLDTGQDLLINIIGLLKGTPSTKGLRFHHIRLLRNYILEAQNKKLILCMHAPPISPNLTYFKRKKLKKLLNAEEGNLKWSEFYEDNLEGNLGTRQIQEILNLKHQTIMYNWSRLLKLITGTDKVADRRLDLVLCGHTHTLKEFRLKPLPHHALKKIDLDFHIGPLFRKIPCEVYTDKYREKIKNYEDPKELEEWFEKNKPFVIQTQAIGPISAKKKFKPPGFRLVEIKNNLISKLDIYSLHLKERSIINRESDYPKLS